MEKETKQFEKALDDYINMVNSLLTLPPRGEGARQQATIELQQFHSQLISKTRNLTNRIVGGLK